MTLSYCLVSFFFFQLAGLPWGFFAGQVYWSQSPSAFIYLGISWFLPHFWRTVLVYIGLLVDIFFLLVLQIYGPTILASKISNEKSDSYLIKDPLCVIIHFSLAALRILFVWLLIVWLWVLVWISLSSSYLEFIELPGCSYLCLSSNLLSFQSLYLQIFSLSLSLSHLLLGLPQCLFWSSWWCPIGVLGSVYFFNLFSSFSSDSIIFIVLSSSWLILSSSCSNLPLNHSSEFFISVFVLCSSKISFWFLRKFSISLLIFPFCSHIVFLNLSHLPSVLWASLRQLF